MTSRGQRRPLLPSGLPAAELEFFTELRRLVDLAGLTCRALEKSTSSVKSATADACFFSKSQWGRWLNAQGPPPRKAIRRLTETLSREDVDAGHLTGMWERAFAPGPSPGGPAGQLIKPGHSAARVAEIDASRPHIARVYDYLLGGKDNFAADRIAGDKIIASMPEVQDGVRAQRAVLRRVVRYLVGEAGIRQLLDIGSGLPTADNVHEIAHRIDPTVRVAYLDNDPVVLCHARALCAGNAATFVVDGDLRDPAGILANPDLLAHLDWGKPIGLLLCGILHHILDEEHPAKLVAALSHGLPPGSYVFIHHLVQTDHPAATAIQAAMQKGLGRGQFRTRQQVGEFFAGLELVEPGLVPVPEWRPDPDTAPLRSSAALQFACAGVART